MDFIQHDGNANHKDQAGEEAQRIRGDMRRNVRPEKQRQRMVNQVDKQRSINEIGDATGFKIQQTMAKGEHHVNHPQAHQHRYHALCLIHPRVPAAIALIEKIGGKGQRSTHRTPGGGGGKQRFKPRMNKCQRPNQEEGNVKQGLHHHEIKQPIAQNGRVDNEQGTPDGGIRDPQRKKQQRQLAQGDVGEEGRGCGARTLAQLAEDQQTHRG